jgi:hypothetical protein
VDAPSAEKQAAAFRILKERGAADVHLHDFAEPDG